MEPVTVIGAGLAGSECAVQLARRGIPVRLCEMKPLRRSPAHRMDGPAELVCSNSFRSDSPETPIGILHAEALRQLGSVGKRSPRLTHRRLRHEQLGSEDIRFALELRGRRPGRDPFRGST